MTLEEIKEAATPLVITYGTRVVGVLVLWLIAWFVAARAGKIVTGSLHRAKVDETLTRFFANSAYWVVLTLAVLASLGIFGVQTTSFAAVIGAAGLAIGLAFQGTLGHLAAGVMLLIFRPFKVGDFITAAGQTGSVNAIDMFTTTLDTPDNRRIIIPNSNVFGSVIENITFHSQRRINIPVGVGYEAEIDRTREVLLAAAQSIPGILETPAPDVFLLELAGSSVNWEVRVWTNSADFGTVKQAAIRSVKLALDAAEISIPFPQMDVHMDGNLESKTA